MSIDKTAQAILDRAEKLNMSVVELLKHEINLLLKERKNNEK